MTGRLKADEPEILLSLLTDHPEPLPTRLRPGAGFSKVAGARCRGRGAGGRGRVGVALPATAARAGA